MNIGARIINNIGAVVELDLNDGDPLVSGLKLPFIYNVSGVAVGGIPFSTSPQGVAYGFELLNTGAVRFSRVAEDRSAVSAQQYVGTATKAQGIAAVASNARFQQVVSAHHGRCFRLAVRELFAPGGDATNWQLGFRIPSSVMEWRCHRACIIAARRYRCVGR